MKQAILETPIGPFTLAFDAEGALHAAGFHLSFDYPKAPLPTPLHAAFNAYFAGDSTAFARVAIALEGTAFQLTVWRALQAIPHGETRSYADIARAIGKPKAVRAVGLANGKNPISIIVPCHRVIGSSGALTGYAGGLARKRWLLAHEDALPA